MAFKQRTVAQQIAMCGCCGKMVGVAEHHATGMPAGPPHTHAHKIALTVVCNFAVALWAEAACHAIPGLQHVKPKDKPLHGLQDAPLKTITAARDAMRAFDAAVACERPGHTVGER